MTDFTTTVNRYIALWNETDASRRKALIAQTMTEDATYVDPLVAIEGREAIDANIASIQARFPAHAMRLAGPVDAHHNLARFTWEVIPDGADEPLVVGFDVAVLAEDGKMQKVHGFLDKVPAL